MLKVESSGLGTGWLKEKVESRRTLILGKDFHFFVLFFFSPNFPGQITTDKEKRRDPTPEESAASVKVPSRANDQRRTLTERSSLHAVEAE